MTPFFYLVFLSISEFENAQNSFPSGPFFWAILVCKIPKFLGKSYRFGQFIMLFEKVNILRFFSAPTHGLQGLSKHQSSMYKSLIINQLL